MPSKKYYLCVTPFFPSHDNWRGPFVLDQIRAIKNTSNYEVIVIKQHSSWDKYEINGIPVYGIPLLAFPSYLFNGFFWRRNAKKLYEYLHSINISYQDIAIVHLHNISFVDFGLLLKSHNKDIQVILQHHDKDPFRILNGKLSAWKPNLKYRAIKSIKAINKVDINIVISEACKDNLLHFPAPGINESYLPYIKRCNLVAKLKLPSVSPTRVIKLYNGVDTSIFHQTDIVQHKNTFTIGCIGNFIPLKAQIDLIKAVSLLPNYNIKCVFIGSGKTLQECKDFVASKHLDNIEFRKEVAHSKLNAFYNSIDLFVLPSHFDGFGCVCTEAYAAGTPFIVPIGNGAAEYIKPQDRTVWTYNAGDYKALSQRIKFIIQNKPTQNIIYPIDINILIKEYLTAIQ